MAPAGEDLAHGVPQDRPGEPERAHADERIELDVPGQANYEIVGYTVEADSRVAGTTLVSLPLPGSVRLIGVLRKGLLAPKSNRLRLKSGDHVYLIAPVRKLERLDHLFLSRNTKSREDLVVGDFDINGQTPLADLLLLLGVDGTTTDPSDTVQKFFERRCTSLTENISINVGNYRITIHRIDHGIITAARVTHTGESTGDQ